MLSAFSTLDYPCDRIGIWRTSGACAQVLDFSFPTILNLFPQHRDAKRADSAAFLIWYLENYYRLTTTEAVFSVCDQPGDRGIDGVVVNNNDRTITFFQSTILQTDKEMGPATVAKFCGNVNQFMSVEAVQSVLDTAPDTALASLLRRLDVKDKLASHEVRGEFITNVDKDKNTDDYLKTAPHLTFIGRAELKESYISDKRDLPTQKEATFSIEGFTPSQYAIDGNTKAVIAPIRATELITLDGIADQSLFAFNVRGPLGHTTVNRGIRDSIRDPQVHKFFPLFHNGITIIAKDLKVNGDSISVNGYYVVNGCQSLTTLHRNRKILSQDLRILTKFVQLEPTSPWAKTVTDYSNNQNGVKARDRAANDPQQIRLQNEFGKFYKGEFHLEVKRGELKPAGVTTISNEHAGLLLLSFDLKEPWASHRSYQVLDPNEKASEVFGRKEVTADRIVLCHTIARAISEALPKIRNQLFAKYGITLYALVYVVRLILENDPLCSELLTNPAKFVRDKADRERFYKTIQPIVADLIVDIDDEVQELGEDFDYRDKLRNAEWVKDLGRELVKDHLKQINRGRIKSFSAQWESDSQNAQQA
jgi:hypothetical protein